MDKIPTADEVLLKHGVSISATGFNNFNDKVRQSMIEFAKLHVKACKKAIDKEAEKKYRDDPSSPALNTEEIMSAYPDKLII